MYMCFLKGLFFPATITFIYRFPKLQGNELKLEKNSVLNSLLMM